MQLTRRGFLGALAAVPLVGRLVPAGEYGPEQTAMSAGMFDTADFEWIPVADPPFVHFVGYHDGLLIARTEDVYVPKDCDISFEVGPITFTEA